MIKRTAATIILMALAALAGFLYADWKSIQEPPEIITIREYRTVYTKPQDMTYEACYRSPLHIDADVTGYTRRHVDVRVVALDACKSKQTDFRLKVGQSGNWKLYVGAGVVGAGIMWVILSRGRT